MQQNISSPKWEFQVSRKLEKCTCDQIWPLFEDFFGYNKYFTVIPTCYVIQGNGEPGSIRVNAGFVLDFVKNKDDVLWVKERLVAIDKVEMTLTYAIMECNIGFNSYAATFKVVPTPNDGSGVVEWHVSVEPVAGLTFEHFVMAYESWLKLILDNMEETISQSKI